MRANTTEHGLPTEPHEPAHADPPITPTGESGLGVGDYTNARSDVSANGWSSIEKLTAVVEIASLTPDQRADYCRQAEVSEGTISEWREQCVKPEFWTSERGKSRFVNAVEAMSYVERLEKELLETGDILVEAWMLYTAVKKALLSVPRA